MERPTVKRNLALVVFAMLALAFALPACSPNESGKQQADAKAAFEQAQKKVKEVADGYVADPKQTGYQGTLRDYQRQLLKEASDGLAPLTTAGSPGQQVTAALALANAQATLARFDADDALVSATNYAGLTDKIIATVVTARSAQTLADTSNKIQNSGSLEAARRNLADTQDQQERVSQQIGKLASQIEQLDVQITDLTGQRDAAMKQAADRRARAFASAGQIRFDLHAGAAELALKADKASGRIDVLAVERNKLDALRQIAEMRKQQLQAGIDAAQRAINEMGQQGQSLAQAAKLGTDTAVRSADDLASQLQSLSKDYNDNVVARFDSARRHLEQAVKALSAAVGKQPDHAADVKLQYAARQAELGHLLRQAAVLYAGHADLMKLIADETKAGFPAAQGDTIRVLAQAAADKAKQGREDADAALSSAEQLLTQAADSAGENSDTGKAALRQLELVRQAAAGSKAEAAPGRG